MFQSLEVLDTIRLNFTSNSLFLLNIILALIMFGVALEIKADSFKMLIKKPKSLLVGVLSQFIVMPAITFLLILILKPSASIALGMILVASCPGGNISNFITAMARGNTTLSVSLTAISDLSAIVLTPLNFGFWGSLYSIASEKVIPIEIEPFMMFKTVFILLGIPLVAGIWFAKKFPKINKVLIKPMKIFSILAFFGFIAVAFKSNFEFFVKYIHLIFWIVLIHNAIALLTGYVLGSIAKVSRINRRSISIETGIQNSGLALVLIFNPNLFDGLGGMAIIAAWWGIWHILSGMGIAAIWSLIPLSNKKFSFKN